MKGLTTYGVLVLSLIAVAGILGFAGPAAVSSRYTELVVGGFGLVLLLPVVAMAIFYIWKRSKEGKGIMKALRKLAPVLMVGLLLGACSKVPAGNVGVIVNQVGSDKGVSEKEVGVGRYWLTWNEDLFLFPTFTQNDTWAYSKDKDESIPFQTGKDGMTMSADFGITFRVDPSKVTKLYQTYRKGIDEISDIYLRNLVRDSLNERAASLTADEAYGSKKNKLMDDVEDDVTKAVAGKGIIVEKVYLIGAIRLPAAVRASIDEKNKSVQLTMQREQEVIQTKFEANKKIEEARGRAESVLLEARAQATANQLVAASITPELVRYRALDKWDGALPRLNGGGTVPFVDVTADARSK